MNTKAPSNHRARIGLTLAWDWIKSWAWTLFPTVPTVWAFVSARIEDIPVWLGILVCSVVFWATISGYSAARSFWSKATVNQKLIIPGLSLGRVLDENQEIKRLSLGVNLANLSELPIQYEITEIRSSLDGKINPNPFYENRGAIIQPLCTMSFWDSAIDVTLNAPKTLEGELVVSLIYGKPGAMKHRISFQYKVLVRARSPSDISSFTWYIK